MRYLIGKQRLVTADFGLAGLDDDAGNQYTTRCPLVRWSNVMSDFGGEAKPVILLLTD